MNYDAARWDLGEAMPSVEPLFILLFQDTANGISIIGI